MRPLSCFRFQNRRRGDFKIICLQAGTSYLDKRENNCHTKRGSYSKRLLLQLIWENTHFAAKMCRFLNAHTQCCIMVKAIERIYIQIHTLALNMQQPSPDVVIIKPDCPEWWLLSYLSYFQSAAANLLILIPHIPKPSPFTSSPSSSSPSVSAAEVVEQNNISWKDWFYLMLIINTPINLLPYSALWGFGFLYKT